VEGAALEGVRIWLTLNDEYTAVLYSDARGNFEASLPAGKWRINEVTVSDWEDRGGSANTGTPISGKGLL
jgi:hypothetical protein